MGQHALYLSESNKWDISHQDKLSLGCEVAAGVIAIPSPTLSPLDDRDFLGPCRAGCLDLLPPGRVLTLARLKPAGF